VLTIIIESNKISFSDIYQVLEKSSPIIRELLKGNDEHAFVKLGHSLALFCEDVARHSAKNSWRYLKNKIKPDDKIKIIVDTDESVHFHNLYCEIDTTIKELDHQLHGQKLP
jgi:GTP cyclohydrolase FolE2